MKKFKSIVALLLAVMIMALGTVCISAKEEDLPRMLVLGDSIASGYGLENPEDAYAMLITNEKYYYTPNYAVPGHTTADLLNIVSNSTNCPEDIKKSDLIVISIGGNDLLGMLGKLTMMDMMDILQNGVNAAKVKAMMSTVETNLDKIMTRIRELNPNAPVIIQTMYNPLYASDQYKAYADTLDGFAPAFNGLYYALCDKFSDVYVADIYTAFDSYYETQGNYDIIQSDGIHPSVSGHKLISEVIINEIDKLEEAGKMPVFDMPVFSFLLGDADGSGKITISDATTIQKYIVGLVSYDDQMIANLYCDADEDGSVTIKDATAVQKHLALLESNPNIGTMVPYYGD